MNIKPSTLLEMALHDIEIGTQMLCCVALQGAADDAEYDYGEVEAAHHRAQAYLNSQKPAKQYNRSFWWPLADKASRIAALKAAIAEAKENGE